MTEIKEPADAVGQIIVSGEPLGKEPGLMAAVARVANYVNENIVGNPITFILAIASVFGVYSLLFFMSYGKWNTGAGLFFNTLSSSFELITGIGAVVGVYAVQRAQKHQRAMQDHHKNEMADLHRKMDAVMKHHGVKQGGKP